MREHTSNLAVGLLGKRDSLLKEAIRFSTGEVMNLVDVAKRCEIRVLPDKTEVFAFDGMELIHFGHIETETVSNGHSVTVRANQSYQLLYTTT